MSAAMQKHLKGCTDYRILKFSHDFLVTHSELSNVALQDSSTQQKTVLKVPLPDFADLNDKVCPKCQSYMCITAAGESANCPCQDLFKQTTVMLHRINETKDHMKFKRQSDYNFVNNEDPLFKKSKTSFMPTDKNINVKNALANSYFRDDNLFEKFGMKSSFDEPMLINNEQESINTDIKECKQGKIRLLPLRIQNERIQNERILFKYDEDDDDDKTQEYPLKEESVFFNQSTNKIEETEHLHTNTHEQNRAFSSDFPSLSCCQQLHNLKMSPEVMENRNNANNTQRFPKICRTGTNQTKLKSKTIKLKSKVHKSKKAWLYRKSLSTFARQRFYVNGSSKSINNFSRNVKSRSDDKQTDISNGLYKVSHMLPNDCLSEKCLSDRRFVRVRKLFKPNKSSFCNVGSESIKNKEIVRNSCNKNNNNKSCINRMYSGFNISSNSKESIVHDENVEVIGTLGKYIKSENEIISPHFVRRQPKKGRVKLHLNKQTVPKYIYNTDCSKEESADNTPGVQMVPLTYTISEDQNLNRSSALAVTGSNDSKTIRKQHQDCYAFSDTKTGNNVCKKKAINTFSGRQPETQSDQRSKCVLTVTSPSKDTLQNVSFASIDILDDVNCDPSAPLNEKLSNTAKKVKDTNIEMQPYLCKPRANLPFFSRKINVSNSVEAIESPFLLPTSHLVMNSTSSNRDSNQQTTPQAVVSHENWNMLTNMKDKQTAKENGLVLHVVEPDKTVCDYSDMLLPHEKTCSSRTIAVEFDGYRSQLAADPEIEHLWHSHKEKLHPYDYNAAMGSPFLDLHSDNRTQIGQNKTQTVVSSRVVNAAHEPLDLSCHIKEQNTLHPELASVQQHCLPQAYTPSLVMMPMDVGYTNLVKLPPFQGQNSSIQNMFLRTDTNGRDRRLSASGTELSRVSKADSQPARISQISSIKQPDSSNQVPYPETSLLNTIVHEKRNLPAFSIHSKSSITKVAGSSEGKKIHPSHTVTNFERDIKKLNHFFIATSLQLQHCSEVASSISTSVYSPQVIKVTTSVGSNDACSNSGGTKTEISKDSLPAQNVNNPSAWTNSSLFNVSVKKNNVINSSSFSGLKNPLNNHKLGAQAASSKLSALPVKDFFTHPPKENTYSSLLLAKITSQKKKHLDFQENTDVFSCLQPLNKSNNPPRNLYIDLTEGSDDCDIVSISSNDSFDEDVRNDFLDITLRDRIPTPASLTACSSISEVTVVEGSKHLSSADFTGEISNACTSVQIDECDFDSVSVGARSENTEHSGLVSRNITDIGISSPLIDGNSRVHNMQRCTSNQVFEFDDISNAEEITDCNKPQEQLALAHPVCDVDINETIVISGETLLHSLNIIPVHTGNLESTEALESFYEEAAPDDAESEKLMTSVENSYTEKIQTKTQQNIISLTQPASINSSLHDNSTQRAAATLLELSANPLYNPYMISPETSDAYQEKVYQVHPKLKVNEESVHDELQQDNIRHDSHIFHNQAGVSTHKFRARTGRRVGRPPKNAYNASDSVNSADGRSASSISDGNIFISVPSGIITSTQMSIKDAVSLQCNTTSNPGNPSNLHNSLSLKSHTKNATSEFLLSQPVMMSHKIYNEFHPDGSIPVQLKHSETVTSFATSSMPYFITSSTHFGNTGTLKTQTIGSSSRASVSREKSVEKCENVNIGNQNHLYYSNSSNYVNFSDVVNSTPPTYVTLSPAVTVGTSAMGINNASCKSSGIISKTLASVKMLQ